MTVDLTIETAVDATGRQVVLVHGSIDLASRELLIDAVVAALDHSESAGVVIDMSGVDFVDSSGIGALVALAGEAGDAGKTFGLRSPSARVVRVLDVTGLSDAWPIDS